MSALPEYSGPRFQLESTETACRGELGVGCIMEVEVHDACVKYV